MTKEEWIKKTAELFEEKAELEPKAAREYAESIFEANEDDILSDEYTPKEAFDDEMDEWHASA